MYNALLKFTLSEFLGVVWIGIGCQFNDCSNT